MDILLYKDGHLAVSESPLEGKENNLNDVVMLVTNPQDGDTLTYKSGKWVNGSGGGGLVVHELYDESTETTSLDKTWQEIFDAVQAGQYVCILEEQDEQSVTQRAIVTVYVNAGKYDVGYYSASGQRVMYRTYSADGYPVKEGGGK